MVAEYNETETEQFIHCVHDTHSENFIYWISYLRGQQVTAHSNRLHRCASESNKNTNNEDWELVFKHEMRDDNQDSNK